MKCRNSEMEEGKYSKYRSYANNRTFTNYVKNHKHIPQIISFHME